MSYGVRRSLWWPCASLRYAEAQVVLRSALVAGWCRPCCGALPRYPLQCVRPVRQLGPCPGEDGKSPGRTSPCGGAVYLSDLADIILFRGGARPPGGKKRDAEELGV